MPPHAESFFCNAQNYLLVKKKCRKPQKKCFLTNGSYDLGFVDTEQTIINFLLLRAVLCLIVDIH